MSKFLIILFSLSFFSTNLIGQEISLSGGFLPYEAYYIQSIDLATGHADVQLFDYLISSTDTIEFHLQFSIEIYSPLLDINEKTTLLNIRTLYKASMRNPVRLDNRDMNTSASGLLDITGERLLTKNGYPLRFDLNAGDAVVARAGTFTETPIGNWTYGNRTYTVTLEIWTLRERQRLYNIMQEIRRICHARMHSLTNFQRIQFVNFDEMTSDTVKVWMGNSQISLENSAVLLET